MFNDKINSSIAEAVKKCMGEELKGDQHKIDANKNNKIDAHDFKLLRAKKKVEEEVEQIDEKKYEPAEYNAAAAAARKKREAHEERRREARENGEDKPKVRKIAGKAYGGAAQKDDEDMNEEFEQIDEVSLGTSPDKLRARAAIQSSGKFPRKGQTDFRNIPGINHPNASDETKEYGERVRANKNEVLKKAIKSAAGTHGPKGKLPEGTVSFSDLIESYKEGGIKSLFKKIEEEVDNETFTKEFKDQKDKFDGKKKGADVAAPASQGVVDVKEETHTEVQVVDMTDGSQKPEITTIDLEEKTLTSGETAEKERIVKSMKKNLPSFKERYGERAKSVMYATATKIAKEKE